jgi:cytochrome c
MRTAVDRTLTYVLAAAALIGWAGAASAQDAGGGEATFKKSCIACHDVGEGAKVKLGPPLNGLDGRAAGSVSGFNYSPAMKSSGITWDAQSFKEYMHSPAQKVPGNRMAFVGMKDDQEIDGLWAFLKAHDAEGKTK